MSIEVGSYEAKTRFSELLRIVQTGESFTITHRGNKVAELIPAGKTKEVAEGVANMQRFIASHAPMQEIDIKSLIEEGRD
jgi:prevent-host-death family protein